MIGKGHTATGVYEFDLCDCCSDPASCILTCICPMISAGQIHEKSGGSCCIGCLIYCFTPYWSCIGTPQFKNPRMIPTNCFNDWIIFCCCTCCELTRQHREAKAHPLKPGEFYDNMV
eukprot:UN32744